MTTRAAEPGDFALAREAHHGAYRDVTVRQFGAWDLARQDQFFQNSWDHGGMEIILQDGEAVGYRQVDHREDDIHLRELVLDPRWQGRGIGTALMRGLQVRSTFRGVPVRLGTMIANRAAAWYRRLGFRETSRTATHVIMEWTPGEAPGTFGLLTERLRFRPPTPADDGLIFQRYASDPAATRYMGWARHVDVATTAEFLAFSEAAWSRWPAGPLLIESRSDGRLLGATGLVFESDTVVSTGYILAHAEWGRGFATEALMAMVRLGSHLGVSRLAALCHPDHAASRRVLEKAGFTPEPRGTETMAFPNLGPEIRLVPLRYSRRLDRRIGADP